MDKKFLVFLIIWAVFLVVLIRFGFLENFTELKDLSDQYDFQKKSLSLIDFRLNDFKNFQRDSSFFEKIKQNIDRSFISKEAPIGFIEFLEGEADKFNLSVEIFPLNIEASDIDPWQPFGFQVLLKGSFPNVVGFLRKLELSPWLNEIVQMNVERVDEDKTKLKGFEDLEIGDVSTLLAVKVFSNEPPKVPKR